MATLEQIIQLRQDRISRLREALADVQDPVLRDLIESLLDTDYSLLNDDDLAKHRLEKDQAELARKAKVQAVKDRLAAIKSLKEKPSKSNKDIEDLLSLLADHVL